MLTSINSLLNAVSSFICAFDLLNPFSQKRSNIQNDRDCLFTATQECGASYIMSQGILSLTYYNYIEYVGEQIFYGKTKPWFPHKTGEEKA